MENKLKYLVVDVDGTMTDAGIYYDERGNELKKFSTKDAVGFFVTDMIGVQVIVLTGRESVATFRRMQEMKVKYLFQNVKDKKSFLSKFMKNNNVSKEEIGYIGDDLNDLAAMSLVGFVACPKDACSEVMEIANYICKVNGGNGVVREVVEYLFKESSEWETAIHKIYSGV